MRPYWSTQYIIHVIDIHSYWSWLSMSIIINIISQRKKKPWFASQICTVLMHHRANHSNPLLRKFYIINFVRFSSAEKISIRWKDLIQKIDSLRKFKKPSSVPFLLCLSVSFSPPFLLNFYTLVLFCLQRYYTLLFIALLLPGTTCIDNNTLILLSVAML